MASQDSSLPESAVSFATSARNGYGSSLQHSSEGLCSVSSSSELGLWAPAALGEAPSQEEHGAISCLARKRKRCPNVSPTERLQGAFERLHRLATRVLPQNRRQVLEGLSVAAQQAYIQFLETRRAAESQAHATVKEEARTTKTREDHGGVKPRQVGSPRTKGKSDASTSAASSDAEFSDVSEHDDHVDDEDDEVLALEDGILSGPEEQFSENSQIPSQLQDAFVDDANKTPLAVFVDVAPENDEEEEEEEEETYSRKLNVCAIVVMFGLSHPPSITCSFGTLSFEPSVFVADGACGESFVDPWNTSEGET